MLKHISTTCCMNLVFVYNFKADHLVLDNQLGGPFLRKASSLALSIPELPEVLCLVVGPHESSPSTLALLLVWYLLRSCLGSRIVEASWVKLPCHC